MCLGLRAPGQEGVWRTALRCFVAMEAPEAGREESEFTASWGGKAKEHLLVL